eukprot:2642213-Rhodomonas_salina.1
MREKTVGIPRKRFLSARVTCSLRGEVVRCKDSFNCLVAMTCTEVGNLVLVSGYSVVTPRTFVPAPTIPVQAVVLRRVKNKNLYCVDRD